MTRSLNTFGLSALALILAATGIYFFLKEDVPKLYINEFMAYSTTCCPDTDGGKEEFNDWIEIYNAEKDPVDIGGMYIAQNKDKRLGHKIQETDKTLTTIKPGGFIILWADGSTEQGVLHLKFKLNQNGEYIGLYHHDGRLIDEVEFGAQQANISYGRTTDGGGEWKEYSEPTPARSNNQ